MAEKTVIEITGAFAPETVESIMELLMERMNTLRVVDFTVETRQTSDEELVAEVEKLSPDYCPECGLIDFTVKDGCRDCGFPHRSYEELSAENAVWTPGDEQEHLL